jgi:threonine synthase
VSLGERSACYENLYVLELFHGPTLSFKDFGARTMARLMASILEKRGESLTILVATSGDTGSAVADGFAGLDAIDVVLLYPKGKVSEVQERQLIVERPGVEVYAVEGTFDDCQRMVKAAFVDEALDHLDLSSANSINIGRLLPQMLYYIWAVVQLGGRSTCFCVPSGNLGNLTGGVMAALSGLPVRQFIAAHNANNFFPLYLEGEREEFKDSVRTLSNAMDVGAPSNFERLTYFWDEEELRRHIWGSSVTDAETRSRMRAVYEATGYIACPHTSVGLEAARRFREQTDDDHPIVVLATAHPAKFPVTVADTLDIEAPSAPALERLKDQPTDYTSLPPTMDALRDELLAAHTG